MAYDTTLLETLPQPDKKPQELPECLKRDRLNNGYFAQITASQLGVVIALCGVFLWTSFHKLHHTDLWGHLNFGRWIATHGSLPAIDPFAATPSETPFIPSAWLSQVAGYWTLEHFGLEGLVFGHALLVVLACGLMILALRARAVPLCWATAGAVAYYLLALPIIGAIRPQLFGMVLAPLVLWASARLPERRWPLVVLPLAFVLWANLHGSFAMGLAMLGLAALGHTWHVFSEKRSWRGVIGDVTCARAWGALGLSLTATTLNPWGPRLVFDVLGFGGNAVLADIAEWRALSLASLSGGLFFVSLALAVVSLKFSRRSWELGDVLLLTIFGLATLSAMRMLAWWACVWPFAVLPYAVSAWQARFGGEDETESSPNAMRTAIALGFVFMTLLMSPAANHLLLGRPRGIGAIASTATPIYVADEIERRQLDGAFFAPMDWADYLVWSRQQSPELKPANTGFRPLVYSHVHLIQPDAWTDYQHIAAGSTDWLARADEHDLRYLVISKERNRPLAASVVKYSGQKGSRATILYQDQNSLLVQLRRG